MKITVPAAIPASNSTPATEISTTGAPPDGDSADELAGRSELRTPDEPEPADSGADAAGTDESVTDVSRTDVSGVDESAPDESEPDEAGSDAAG